MSATLSKWLKNECSVPWVLALETVREKHQFELLLKAGLPYLMQCGYQKIGVMYSTDQGDAKAVADEILPTLPQSLKVQYIKTSNNHSEQGLSAVNEQIDPGNCPDALFVLNDNLCRGAIVGLLAMGLHFPGKIGLLTHANKGIGILAPVELSRIEYAPIDILHSNIDRIFGLLNDEDSQPCTNSISIVHGQSCVHPAC
jgi:DNA-binding LacI/PurR family transcriptional regulator